MSSNHRSHFVVKRKLIHHGDKISLFGDFESITVSLTHFESLSFADIFALNRDLTKWINEVMDKSIEGYERAAKQNDG